MGQGSALPHSFYSYYDENSKPKLQEHRDFIP